MIKVHVNRNNTVESKQKQTKLEEKYRRGHDIFKKLSDLFNVNITVLLKQNNDNKNTRFQREWCEQIANQRFDNITIFGYQLQHTIQNLDGVTKLYSNYHSLQPNIRATFAHKPKIIHRSRELNLIQNYVMFCARRICSAKLLMKYSAIYRRHRGTNISSDIPVTSADVS